MSRTIPVSVMISLFRRKGGETENTRVIEEAQQAEESSCLPLEPSERIVLRSRTSPDDLVLITDQKIHARSKSESRTIDLTSVRACEQDVMGNYRLGARDKRDFSSLQLTLADGSSLSLSVEKGRPYWGILNVLKWIAGRMNSAEALERPETDRTSEIAATKTTGRVSEPRQI